jgi:hypothetical protein
MFVLMRIFNCALLLMLTGAMAMWLRITIEPSLPSGNWHGVLTGLFLCVWPALAWSLRSLARFDPADPYRMLWMG